MATAKKSALVTGPEIGLLSVIEKQESLIRLGQCQRFARLDALCFEVNKDSNPRMLELGKQKTPDGRQAWPGKNLDWLGQGPPLAWAADMQIILPAIPFPLPPPVPDPTFKWEKVGDAPKLISQRISDRAVAIRGTRLLCIQPVSSIQWILDNAMPGRPRREIHQVVADSLGQHMAFILDLETRTGHLVGGRVL